MSTTTSNLRNQPQLSEASNCGTSKMAQASPLTNRWDNIADQYDNSGNSSKLEKSNLRKLLKKWHDLVVVKYTKWYVYVPMNKNVSVCLVNSSLSIVTPLLLAWLSKSESDGYHALTCQFGVGSLLEMPACFTNLSVIWYRRSLPFGGLVKMAQLFMSNRKSSVTYGPLRLPAAEARV